MAVKKRKPTSPGRRFQTVSDFAEITADTPEKSLIDKKGKTGGRNSYGRVTSRHRGGGHKQRYRIIDFKREKDDIRPVSHRFNTIRTETPESPSSTMWTARSATSLLPLR